MAVWVPSSDWLSRKIDFFQALRWRRRARWGECSPCPDFASHTLTFVLQLMKIMENLSQSNRKALDWSALNAIPLDDLAIAGDGLDWPAEPCRPWLSWQATVLTLGQRKYLSSCRTRGFPTSANFELKLAVRALMWSVNSGTPRSLCICLLRIYQGHQWQGEDTWIVTLVASGHGCGQRTSTQGTHNPSWGGWTTYIAGLRSWRRDHSSYSGGDPVRPSFEQFSF